jgi:hypothetical protein
VTRCADTASVLVVIGTRRGRCRWLGCQCVLVFGGLARAGVANSAGARHFLGWVVTRRGAACQRRVWKWPAASPVPGEEEEPVKQIVGSVSVGMSGVGAVTAVVLLGLASPASAQVHAGPFTDGMPGAALSSLASVGWSTWDIIGP